MIIRDGGELTTEATKISYSSQIHPSSMVQGYLDAGLPATLGQFGSGP